MKQVVGEHEAGSQPRYFERERESFTKRGFHLGSCWIQSECDSARICGLVETEISFGFL